MADRVTPLATFDYAAGGLEATLEFLKRTRAELRMLRKARVYLDRVQVIDINRDCFQVTGLGYRDSDVTAVLNAVNTAFDPQTIHEDTTAEYKEFDTGRRYPWAQDRVM